MCNNMLFPLFVLLTVVISAAFVSCRYAEDSNNCFDFVLQFLRLFLHTFSAEVQDDNPRLTWNVISSKETFCSMWVLPQTRRAARYILLYRRLLSEGFVIDARDQCIEDETEQQFVNTESCMTHL